MNTVSSQQTKWRRDYFLISILFSVVCLITELVLTGANALFHNVSGEERIYRIGHLYIPALIHFGMILMTYFHIQSRKVANIYKNAWVCILIMAICVSSQILHYPCKALLCLPCVAIFMSVLFVKERITLTLTILGTVSTLVASYLSFRTGEDLFDLIVETVIAGVVIWMSYIASRLIIRYVRDQIYLIANSSNREKDLLMKMRLDPLMGIYNRGGMEKIMDQLIEGFDESHPMSLIMIDLDHFKKINDTYGHQNGDVVLMDLADTIGNLGRKNVMPCRYGGEEVVIILKNCNMKQAYERFMGLLTEFRSHRFDFNPNLMISFSGGLSEYHAGMTKDEWLKKADDNLYHAKQTGRNRIYPEFSVFYSVNGRTDSRR